MRSIESLKLAQDMIAGLADHPDSDQRNEFVAWVVVDTLEWVFGRNQTALERILRKIVTSCHENKASISSDLQEAETVLGSIEEEKSVVDLILLSFTEANRNGNLYIADMAAVAEQMASLPETGHDESRKSSEKKFMTLLRRLKKRG
jgi:hypothetical protein